MENAISPQAYKSAMRRLAASVSIITTATPDGARHGLTATAICSVSAEPPVVLFCIHRVSNTRPILLESDHFAINLLRPDCGDVASCFASALSQEERFASGQWHSGPTGTPILRDAVVAFECRRINSVEMGDHTVFFGEVQNLFHAEEAHLPLLYAQGSYGQFSAAS